MKPLWASLWRFIKVLLISFFVFLGSPLATILPCPANLVTVTVTKKATCAIPKHALKPSRCLCSTAAQKTIYRTVFVNNPNREIIHNKNHNHHSVINNIIQPSVQVGNNLPQWQKRSNKCNESFAVQTNPAKAGMWTTLYPCSWLVKWAFELRKCRGNAIRIGLRTSNDARFCQTEVKLTYFSPYKSLSFN